MSSTIAPLRAVVETSYGTTEIFGVTWPTLIHKLECGHTAEPLVRAGCRLPYPPKKRRCKECLKAECIEQ
jgi:hypothetical protein